MTSPSEHSGSLPAPFRIVDVSVWPEQFGEEMGSKAKVWLTAPTGDRWLFKRVRGDAERAEDWPEKVAAELASDFGIPAATVELASHRGERGVISLSVADGYDLVHGNQLLYDHNPAYDRDARRPERGYTLSAVADALADCSPPPSWHRLDWTAFEVFAGYLCFDALIANQDRHHENWAVLVDRADGRRALSPSFDHASSLGFMLTDVVRHDRLVTKDAGRTVERWAERGRGHFEGRPQLVQLASWALKRCRMEAAAWWVARLRGLEPAVWDTTLDRIPESRMSDAARSFASRTLSVNRRRLLNACRDVHS